MVFIGIIIFGIIIFGAVCIIISSIEEEKKLKQMTPNEKEEYLRKQKEMFKEAQDRAKYNGLKYTCPMCKSHKIKTISKTSRSTSVAFFGRASDKIGRLYECDDCKYKW